MHPSMESLLYKWSLLLVAASLLSTVTSQQCTAVCPDDTNDSNIFQSRILLNNVDTRNATISWSPYTGTGQGSTTYIVQHRLTSGASNVYTQSPELNNTLYTITGLEPSKQYAVRICLSGTVPLDCGNCLKCFTTEEAQEPPGPPIILTLESSGPLSIDITWREPSVINEAIDRYIIVYTALPSGVSMNLTITVRSGLVLRATINAQSNTTYNVTMMAENAFGISEPSPVMQVLTQTFSVDPAALLVAETNEILYYRVNEGTNTREKLIENGYQNLINISSSEGIIRDMDYHFHNREIYATFNGSSFIMKYTVSITINDATNLLDLSLLNASTVYSSLPTGIDSISVDWANNVLYWVVISESTSQIYTGPLSGGSISTVGSPIPGVLRSLTVDPVHGYFYWVISGVHLIQVPLSVIQNSYNSTVNLTSAGTVLCSEDDVLFFTLDLADSTYFIAHGKTVTSRGLTGNSIDSRTFSIPFAFNDIASYSDVVYTYGQAGTTAAIIFSALSNSGSNNEVLEVSDSEFHNIKMFRGSYQPLPIPPTPPTNITVLPTSTSATIRWSAPVYSSAIFGNDAYSAWEYQINYRLHGSSVNANTSTTSSASLVLTDLQPDTIYEFTLTAVGPGGPKQTVETYIFNTHPNDQRPELLIAGNEGVIRTNHFGDNPTYVLRADTDRSTDVIYNSLLDIYYIVNSDGQFLSINNGVAMTALSGHANNNPLNLQLDWIARRLYWVESSRRIASVSTVNFTASDNLIETFYDESVSITDMAIDSSTGVMFWIAGSNIMGRTLNGLHMFTCLTLPNSPNALTIDPVNNRLYYISISSSTVTIGQVTYSTFQCSNSHLTRSISQLPLAESSSTSMAYGANTLFITQSTLTKVYSIPASIQLISSSNSTLAVGIINASPQNPVSNIFRSISVISSDIQPLPDGLTSDMTGNVSVLTPPPSGIPVLNNDTSNSTFIDVTWDPPNFNLSTLVYILTLNLTRVNNEFQQITVTIMSGNCYKIPGQLFSTRVDATIITYSYWYSTTPVSNTFFSPAALPGQVGNVRVYTYFPIRNSKDALSGLVVWDGLSAIEAGGVVNNYFVNIFDANTGQPLTDENVGFSDFYNGPPFAVDGTMTEFSLTIQGIKNRQYFILRPNQMYNVEVFASNSAGNGTPSNTVTFQTNTTESPLEVLASSSNGGLVESDHTNITLSQVTPPIALDTLQRTVYYYNSQEHSVYTRSLDANGRDNFLVKLQNGFIPLGFGYDWIAQTLYIIGRTSQGKVNIWSVFRLFPEGLSLIYNSTDVVSKDVVMSLVVNPFNGLLHWTESTVSSSRLNQLNLSDKTFTSLISSSSKRNIDSTLLEPTALVWDTVTERLWFCDRASNNIVSYNITEQLPCEVEVNGSMFISSNETGLPCDSLTLDESRIYWTISSTMSLYYVTRNDPDILLTLPLSSNSSVILSTSPGLQPYPNIQIISGVTPIVNCLSPDFASQSDRPVPTVVNMTNTTAFITWTVNDNLRDECLNKVVSVLPLTYRVNLEISMVVVPGYPKGSIFERQFSLTDLLPYTEYMVEVEARNQFTENNVANIGEASDLYGTEIPFRTTEGIPDAVTGLTTIVFGPHHIFFSWNKLDTTQLRGSIDNQTFQISIDNNRTIDTANDNITDSTLEANTSHTFSIIASNGVLLSAVPSTISNTTWVLPPRPKLMSNTNTSLVAMVTLEENHSVLTSINIYVKLTSTGNVVNSSNISTTLSSLRPLPLMFNFTGLEPHTNYMLVVEGHYQSVQVNGIELPEVTINRTGDSVLTSAGVPDKPDITVTGNSVTWSRPGNNGAEITGYILSYRGTNDNATALHDIAGSNTQLNLNTLVPPLQEGVNYTLTLVAQNRIGDSEGSDPKFYTRQQQKPFYEELPFIISVSVGGVVLILVLILLFLFCCCCCLAPRKGNLSFSPDYELSRLRALHSHSHSAANPNYLWRSLVDYNCTDEDLELLTKFPRNKLRLENFIDRGEFGEVYQGTALDILGQGTGPTPVAVKTMRKGSSNEEQRKFLSEAALMSNFNHLNIVKVLGVCLDNDPIYIIMELMPGGDLLKFLRDARRDHGPALLTLSELVQITLDVAQGCRYLEQQHFIHRDIAARNCLVSSRGADRVVKIGDFGLAKDLYSSDYYQVEGQRKLPVRWMAPEALLQGKFTIESDIWSYGILLWEIMTLGNQPYPGRTNQEVLQFVTGGGRLERPENCPGRLYKIMQCCWKKYASERPHFSQVVDIISNFLDHLNSKRDSYCSDDDDEDVEEVLQRRPSRPSRTSSVRSGFIQFARQGSMRIRNSFRRRSLHRKDELDLQGQNHTGLNSEEDLIGDDRFRERGPF